jgi:hypothetical protein
MDITTNSSIYTAITSLQTNSSTKTKSINDLVSGTDSFTVFSNQKTQASDYTYDDYKKLSAKDINEIFPWDKMPNENEKAQKLQLIATLSPDETLNQVLFDQAKNADFNDISTRNFFNRTLESAQFEKALLSFNPYETSDEEFLKTLSEKDKLAFTKDNNRLNKLPHYMESLYKNIDGIVDAKTYFDTYEMGKNYFNDYRKDLSEYSQKYWPGEFALFDKVKSEYEKRVSLNDTMLNQFTKNSKNNPLETNI